jgi:hypothetical protein
MTVPLMLDERPIGKLSLAGAAAGRHAIADMQLLLDYLESLDEEIAVIVAGDAQAAERLVAADPVAAVG